MRLTSLFDTTDFVNFDDFGDDLSLRSNYFSLFPCFSVVINTIIHMLCFYIVLFVMFFDVKYNVVVVYCSSVLSPFFCNTSYVCPPR